jgi:hypothetical protein
MADPRLTPARPDLAARYLEGKVAAARFVDGVIEEVTAPAAPLRRAPRHDAALDTEALKGERVTVYERREGWAWGQLASDGYVGWLPEAALAAPGAVPTHKVAALRTFAFPGPSIKLPPVATLSLGAVLAVTRIAGEFAITIEGHHIPARHVAPCNRRESDFVAVAETFVGTPYLWGGKTSLGIDCSGLVQVSLTAAGIGAPRDSDMQQGALGADVPLSEIDRLRRGDLMFWKGHVAIVRDAHSLLHANAFHMATAIEPLREAVARIAAAGSEVVAIKRL